jgi:hypothetical protein
VLAEQAVKASRGSKEAAKTGRQMGRGATRITTVTPDAAKKLKDAQKTLNLLKRPLWHDTTAIALAKSEQSGHQVMRYLGISDAGFSPETRRGATALAARIGKSKDADEILEAMNELNLAPYAQRLDPGVIMLGRMRYYNRVVNGVDSAGNARDALEGGRRLANGLDNIEEEVVKTGTLMRMGHANTALGRQKSANEVNELLEKWFRIDGATKHDMDLRKRELWDEMWGRIEANMKTRPVPASERKAIEKWARRSGTVLKESGKDAWHANAWNAAKAASEVANPRHGRWKKSTEGVYETAADSIDDAVDVTKPVHDWQTAKDLVYPVNPQKLAAFQRGDIGAFNALSWELRQTSGFIPVPFGQGRRIVSPDAVTTAFKQLVIGRPLFALTVVGIDEFWRPDFQEALWKRVFKRVFRSKADKKLKTMEGMTAALRSVTQDELAQMTRGADHFDILPPTVLDEKTTMGGRLTGYTKSYNGHMEALSQEPEIRMLSQLPRKEGEAAEDYAERFGDALEDFVMGRKSEPFTHLSDDEFAEVSARFRVSLQERGLDYRTHNGNDFIPAAQVAADREAYNVQLEQVWDDIASAHGETDALVAESAKLRASITGREGAAIKFTQPSKDFRAAWLRREHPGETSISSKGATRQLTDDEVLSAFQDDLADEATKSRLWAEWKDAKMAKLGKADEWSRYKEIKAAKAEQSKRLRVARARQKELENAGVPRCEPGSRLDAWIKHRTAKTLDFMWDDELLDAMLNGKKLSHKQLKAIRSRLNEQGHELPTIIGVKASPDWGPGSIPGITELNALTTNKVMNKVSTAMNRCVFLDNFEKEHNRLLALGIKGEEAFDRASAFGRRAVDRVLYKHAASPIENAGRNVALFLPAYRQATVYWAKQFAKHPFVLNNIRNRTKNDYPMVRVGDYQFSVPKPFWTANNFGDIGIPGLGPMILMPLRAANSFTGYTKQSDGKLDYTGATKLDALADIAPLSFMGKTSSPLSYVDDLLYGVLGDNMYALGEDQGYIGAVVGAGMRSLFRDEKKRAQLSINIANAQISRGAKPDYGKAFSEMREKPWWQDICDAVFEGGQAEGILAGVTRQGFISRVAYKPADLGPTKGKLTTWERLFGSQAISMSDAEYEFMEANGDQKKMQAVLDKYPNYAAKVNFWNMNARERADYLSNPSNLWLLPYVQGKSNYDIGDQALTAGEYSRALKTGGIYRKSVDEYLTGLDESLVNVGWYKTLKGLETDLKADQAKAHRWALGVIKRLSVSPEAKERYLSELKFYEKGWMDDLPAKDRYSTSKPVTAPDWMELAAKQEGIYNDPFKWSAYALQMRYDVAVSSVGSEDVLPRTLGFANDAELKRKKPEGAETRGIEDKYVNGTAYGGKNWDIRMGAALKVVDELKKYVSPKYRDLFDKRRSVSWATINDTLKENASYRDYGQTKLAGGKYWELTNVADAMEALGAKVTNRDGLNRAAVRAQTLYDQFTAKAKGLDTWDKNYIALRNAYKTQLDKLLSSDAAAPLRNGPPGRLLNTYLVQPGANLKPNRNYISHVVAAMQKGNLNPQALAASYQQRGRGLTPTQARKVRTATGWAALISTAVVYRNEMKKGWSDEWKGLSPSSTKGEKYVNRLKKLAGAWSRLDDDFRKQYEELGGDDCLSEWLDALY